MLDGFIQNFTTQKINYVKVGNRFFLENKRLEINRIQNAEKTMEIFGLYLGEEKNHCFNPSFGLLDLLAGLSDEKIMVNDYGELDFLYGKNLRKRHVVHIQGSRIKGCLKLVQNKHNENLGYGELVQQTGESVQVLHHILDRGVFIKRDKKPEL